MKVDHVKGRLHEAMHRGSQDAMHRGGRKVSEEELGDVTAVVLAIVAEVTAEMAMVIAELAMRLEVLENKDEAPA